MSQIVFPDKRDPDTYAVIGAAMEVHRVLGRFLVEPVYQAALEWEFTERRVPFVAQVALPVYYKRVRLQTAYRGDFLCFDKILVELKAIDCLSKKEETQIINYLAVSGLKLGLLLNFGSSSLQYKRFAGAANL